jgi:hypothetical protein
MHNPFRYVFADAFSSKELIYNISKVYGVEVKYCHDLTQLNISFNVPPADLYLSTAVGLKYWKNKMNIY